MNKKITIGLIVLIVVAIVSLSYVFYYKESFGMEDLSIEEQIDNLKTKIEELPSKYISKDKPITLAASRRDRDEPNFFQTMTTRKVNNQWVPILETGLNAENPAIPASHPPRVEKYYIVQN